MNISYIKKIIMIVGLIAVNIVVALFMKIEFSIPLNLQYTVCAPESDEYQVFYSLDGQWDESQSIKQQYNKAEERQRFKYTLPKDIRKIRLDFGNNTGEIQVSNIYITYFNRKINITEDIIGQIYNKWNIEDVAIKDNNIFISRVGNDPYIEVNFEKLVPNNLGNIDTYLIYIIKAISLIVLDIVAIMLLRKRRMVIQAIKDVLSSKRLIWNLSKNDFKTKYAGSYLGITWAFVQPVVTVLVYWFVFQVGFRSGNIDDYPFLLWLVAGMVPWFYFSDAIINASNSLIEYAYLVKKVVFKISVLPIVKIISSLYVHLFFLGFTMFIFILYGYWPDIYSVQVIYYTLCICALVLGLSYATSAIMVFFKDLGQIIGIFLQVGMWMTPIMWNSDIIPARFEWIFKINPMFYIIQGYRDSLLDKVWFWDRCNQTVYFWIVVLSAFCIGMIIFKRLKVHFADVL